MAESKRINKNSNSRRSKQEQESKVEGNAFQEKVVHINRCANVVKGGRRFSFSALVVVGDGSGRVGLGYGKSKEVPDAIRKATERAKNDVRSYQLKGETVPHMSIGVSDGGKVLLRPAAPGTGVIAGGGVRAVLEALGVKDILTKSMGSNNPISIVRATLNALSKMRTVETVRALRAARGE